MVLRINIGYNIKIESLYLVWKRKDNNYFVSSKVILKSIENALLKGENKMQKTLIIYKSETGFTQKYAKWLSNEIQT